MKEHFYINSPQAHTTLVPFLMNAPHSGQDYSADFLAACQEPLASLRQQEDFAVDKLFASAPQGGVSLMAATFPRAFIDLNREAYELDPEMFDGPLPPFINAGSASVINGIGTIARRCANGKEIYRKKLRWAEAQKRIETYYLPYHQQLQRELEKLKAQFGWVALLDCHSMPSKDSQADIVLGTRFGKSCSPALRDFICQLWTSLDYRVAENDPYAGGFITKHYGQPRHNQFAVQMEINRSLYMDESSLKPNAHWGKLAADIALFLRELKQFNALAQAAQ